MVAVATNTMDLNLQGGKIAEVISAVAEEVTNLVTELNKVVKPSREKSEAVEEGGSCPENPEFVSVNTGYDENAPINIYVANLHDYNCGRLVGEWISLPQDEDVLKEVVAKISRGYEIAIHDYECEFMEISEYQNIYQLNEFAETLQELEEYEKCALMAIIQNECNVSFEEALERVEDGNYRIYSDCSSMSDVACEIIQECGMTQNHDYYFDYEAFARDLELDGYNPYNYCGCGDEDCEACNEARRREEEGDIDYMAVAYELYDEGCVCDETKERYFDYEAFGRDLDIEGTFVRVNHDTYVELF